MVTEGRRSKNGTMFRSRIAWLIVATGAAALAGGCSSGLKISDAPFRGPAIESSPGERFHEVLVESPTPGWQVEFDQSRRTRGGHDVFLTLRRPDPQFLYPAVISPQTRTTDVRTDSSVRILARVLEFDGNSKGVPYRAVPGASSDGTVGPTPESGK